MGSSSSPEFFPLFLWRHPRPEDAESYVIVTVGNLGGGELHLNLTRSQEYLKEFHGSKTLINFLCVTKASVPGAG
jgi:hypothetical protein